MKNIIFIFLTLVAGALILLGCESDRSTGADNTGNKAAPSGSGAPSDASTGKTAAQSVSEADLGVPFYPGSTPQPDGSMRSEMNGYSVATALRSTSDSSQKVIDFYKDAFSKAGYKPANESVGSDMSTVDGLKGDGDMLSCTFTHDKDQPTSSIMVKRTTKKAGA